MKPILLLFFVFSLLLFVESSYGRKEPGEYWKVIMKDQSMPEAIKNLITQNHSSDKKIKFVKDFDVGANSIIYHSRDINKRGQAKTES
ncbi:organ-specific protein P4 [Tripterygium wilfordii]|uniref:Organ-specific protein P4 n=1 Tax=Tripterygium wilfordii TaxID=458696 RepID=A0A7J7DXL8_TRIWF|nr:organ-specific protein P4 [Tripterygium wilfordii]